MQDTTPIVADDEEAIEHPKGDSRNSEEVHRGDGLSMVTEKRKPVFREFRISRGFAHPTGDRSLRNIKAEHEKFTMNPGRSPRRIFGDHLEDQILNLFRDSPSANPPTNPRNDAPIELKPSSMPPNNGVGKHNHKKLLPVRPELPSSNPEEFIEQFEPWSGMAALEHCELLP
jgi:hypothetical protein